MKSHQILLLIFISSSVFFQKVHALAPVESLILGNFSGSYSENKSDPLDYVYSRELSIKNYSRESKNELAQYRGFYEEGKNAINFCRQNPSVQYTGEWEKTQVKRSTMATIQYIGLDLISRALPQYAKALDYSRDEYVNMVDGLVGNYCSANLSVISKRELLNNFYVKYDKENNFRLPTTAGNPYFPANIESYLPAAKALEQELLFTVKLFKSLCSWSGSPNNPGLMVPMLKHSGLMAFIGRQMANLTVSWKESDNTIFLKEDKLTTQIWCENLICRKTTPTNFNSKFFYSVGGTSINEDIKRLYCKELRNTNYNPKESDPKIAKIMNSMTFDEENLINSQFIALITGIPDLFVRADKFIDGADLFRSGIDFTWSNWAKKMSDNFTRDLFFEEPLTLEQVDSNQYYKYRDGKLKIAFDVNLGEFDRINQRAGKVRVHFNIFIQNSFLTYYKDAIKNLNYKDSSEKNRLKKRFKMQISKDVAKAREKFIIPPWRGDLEELIANEITSQIMETPEKFLELGTLGMRPIEVEINYGLFALKYINHQFNVRKARLKSAAIEKK